MRGIVRDCRRRRRRLPCRCPLRYRFVRFVQVGLWRGLVRDVLPGTGRFRLSGGRTGRAGRIGRTGWLRHGAPLQNPLHCPLSHGGTRTPTLALCGFRRCRLALAGAVCRPGAVCQSFGQPLGHMPSVPRRFHTPIACAAAATWMVTGGGRGRIVDGREACLFTRISWNT